MEMDLLGNQLLDLRIVKIRIWTYNQKTAPSEIWTHDQIIVPSEIWTHDLMIVACVIRTQELTIVAFDEFPPVWSTMEQIMFKASLLKHVDSYVGGQKTST